MVYVVEFLKCIRFETVFSPFSLGQLCSYLTLRYQISFMIFIPHKSTISVNFLIIEQGVQKKSVLSHCVGIKLCKIFLWKSHKESCIHVLFKVQILEISVSECKKHQIREHLLNRYVKCYSNSFGKKMTHENA